LSSPAKGKLVENLVQFKIRGKNYWREGTSEVDFVQIIENKVVPIESKYSIEIKQRDLNGLLKFMKKFKVDEGIVVSESDDKNERVHNKNIRFVPLWKWLLDKG